MYNFEYIQGTSKAEQVRAWSIEAAIESTSMNNITTDLLIKRASFIEKFVLEGNDPNG